MSTALSKISPWKLRPYILAVEMIINSINHSFTAFSTNQNLSFECKIIWNGRCFLLMHEKIFN